MKKLLSLLSALTISGTSVPTAIAASTYEQKYQTVIKTNGLDLPTEQQIKDKLREIYNIDVSKINITNITESSATLNSNDKTFNDGEPRQVLFTIDKSVLSNNLNKNLVYDNQKNTIEYKLFLLNYDIEKKETEISDAREYYEKYSKLYAETLDTGYLEYANNYRKQIKLFRKHLNIMENTKSLYIQRIQYLNQQ